jgi:hypothetical protein
VKGGYLSVLFIEIVGRSASRPAAVPAVRFEDGDVMSVPAVVSEQRKRPPTPAPMTRIRGDGVDGASILVSARKKPERL